MTEHTLVKECYVYFSILHVQYPCYNKKRLMLLTLLI